MAVCVAVAALIGVAALPAAAHIYGGIENTWGPGMVFTPNRGTPGPGQQCVEAWNQQQHGDSSIGRRVTTSAKYSHYNDYRCGGLLDKPAGTIRHKGWVYTAPWKGAAGSVCIMGGYIYNSAGQDVLSYVGNENAWTQFCGSRGTWVTHDTQQEVLSNDNAWWYIGFLRPATAHPYP